MCKRGAVLAGVPCWVVDPLLVPSLSLTSEERAGRQGLYSQVGCRYSGLHCRSSLLVKRGPCVWCLGGVWLSLALRLASESTQDRTRASEQSSYFPVEKGKAIGTGGGFRRRIWTQHIVHARAPPGISFA
eukprot:jgi/Botrbrau1/6134/Bobra.331_2s0029.1